MKISLFIPCLTEHLYPESALSMVKIFRHLGHDVDYVEDQTCCGQPAYNSGYQKEIISAAERFIKLFKGKEYVVAPSGSCVTMVRVFYKTLDISENLRSPLKDLCSKIFEFSEFMVDVLKVNTLGGSFSHKVTYHDSCHLKRELGVYQQPRKLIQSIKDIEFQEMEQSDLCCGFGGTFSYKVKDVSLAMVARKCRYIEESRAEYCIGADSSCLMNIEGYFNKHKKHIKTMHIADLLACSINLL
jgi:L-lactate dehydrogenase complex protein LldE